MANRFTGKSKSKWGRRTPGRKAMKKRWSMRRRKPRSEFSTSMTSFFKYDRWQPTIVSTVASTASYTYVGTTFQLSDINSTDLAYFQGLFDQYRITGVEVAFWSLTNPDASYTANSATTTNANNLMF